MVECLLAASAAATESLAVRRVSKSAWVGVDPLVVVTLDQLWSSRWGSG
jgi:hypothetical protein